MDTHTLHREGCEAEIAQTGAELQALRVGGIDVLWGGGPLWPRRAPLLFPIVGGLKGDALHHQGSTFPMPRHGFARDRDFAWIRRGPTGCTLELKDDAGTRSAYPFPFRLEVSYELEPSGLHMRVTLENPGHAPLPASLGLPTGWSSRRLSWDRSDAWMQTASLIQGPTPHPSWAGSCP